MSEWVSVKERLPQPGEIYLMCCMDEMTQDGRDPFVGFMEQDESEFNVVSFYKTWDNDPRNVTHWMELPEEPEDSHE